MVKKRRITTPNSTTKTRSREASSPQSGDEVLTARDRFKGALQYLLPPQSDDDSESSDDDERHWHSSRAKRLCALKKKQSEKQNEQKGSGPRPFVMKLFDRSVDLAQFNETSPLYPICRAWMINQPHQIYNSALKKEEPKEEGGGFPDNGTKVNTSKNIFKLPPPELSMEGNNKMRIPPQTPYITKFNKMDLEGSDLPSKEQLLQDNLSHWTKVRMSWLDACAKNEARYKSSLKILASMLNK